MFCFDFYLIMTFVNEERGKSFKLSDIVIFVLNFPPNFQKLKKKINQRSFMTKDC